MKLLRWGYASILFREKGNLNDMDPYGALEFKQRPNQTGAAPAINCTTARF